MCYAVLFLLFLLWFTPCEGLVLLQELFITVTFQYSKGIIVVVVVVIIIIIIS
jgi:hypothetical protein